MLIRLHCISGQAYKIHVIAVNTRRVTHCLPVPSGRPSDRCCAHVVSTRGRGKRSRSRGLYPVRDNYICIYLLFWLLWYVAKTALTPLFWVRLHSIYIIIVLANEFHIAAFLSDKTLGPVLCKNIIHLDKEYQMKVFHPACKVIWGEPLFCAFYISVQWLNPAVPMADENTGTTSVAAEAANGDPQVSTCTIHPPQTQACYDPIRCSRSSFYNYSLPLFFLFPRVLFLEWATCPWSVQLVGLFPAPTAAPKTACPCWREWWMQQRAGSEPWEQLLPPGPSLFWELLSHSVGLTDCMTWDACDVINMT